MNIKNASQLPNSYQIKHKQPILNASESPEPTDTITVTRANPSYKSTTNKSNSSSISIFTYNDKVIKRIEDKDGQSDLTTNDSIISQGYSHKTMKAIRKQGMFVPLSKLSSSSIENISKIIQPLSTRLSHLDEDPSRKTHKGHTLSVDLNSNRDMLQQLMKNQSKNKEGYDSKTHKPMSFSMSMSMSSNMKMNNTNNTDCISVNNDDISFNNSIITSSSVIQPQMGDNVNQVQYQQKRRSNHMKSNSTIVTSSSGLLSKGIQYNAECEDECKIEAERNEINTTMSLILPENFIDNTSIISYEDLLLIEDKLHDILTFLQLNSLPHNECFEWWNFYFNSSLTGKYVKYFQVPNNQKKIISYTNIELLCVMLCYAISSYNPSKLHSYLKSFLSIFTSLHFNLLLMIKLVIIKQKGNDLSYMKLTHMLKKSLSSITEKDVDENLITNLIMHNMKDITVLYLGIVDKEYQNSMGNSLKYFFHYAYDNREKMIVEEYDEFFRMNVIKVKDINGSILASSMFVNEKAKEKDKEKENECRVTRCKGNANGSNIVRVIKPKVPFLPMMNPKYNKYTLVLDLDETLIHLKDNTKDQSNSSSNNQHNSNNHYDHHDNNNKSHSLIFRPHMLTFLKKMKSLFEIIVFTAGTQEYARPIIEAIESNEKYFSFCLYREHVLVVDNNFIKDITKLGRDISKIIIVDNKPQNFKLQKPNGIFIKPFYGDNSPKDEVLKHLTDILIQILDEKGDVRNGITKYKNDILTKVTLNK